MLFSRLGKLMENNGNKNLKCHKKFQEQSNTTHIPIPTVVEHGASKTKVMYCKSTNATLKFHFFPVAVCSDLKYIHSIVK